MRLALILGLHPNIPEAQLPDKAARQLRVRAWWTVYILDRMLASKVGYPTLIRDDDIEVGLPCDTGLNDEQKADFVNANYLSANARLAKVAGDIITTLYNRKRLSETFSQRVQNIFKSLRDWFATLPEDVQMNSEKSQGQVARHITLLHLSFNQVCRTLAPCVITTDEHSVSFWRLGPYSCMYFASRSLPIKELRSMRYPEPYTPWLRLACIVLGIPSAYLLNRGSMVRSRLLTTSLPNTYTQLLLSLRSPAYALKLAVMPTTVIFNLRIIYCYSSRKRVMWLRRSFASTQRQSSSVYLHSEQKKRSGRV